MDVVLHVGAVASLLADQHPKLAHRVNADGMQNLIRAITGLPDPIRVAQFDEYGQTKVIAERLLVD